MNDPKDKEPQLLEHEADGIRELDNMLPRWWVWLFYLTIIFSVLYLLYYHVFRMGDLQAAAYTKEQKAGEIVKNAALGRFETTMATLQPITGDVPMSTGLQVYTTMCSPCHRPDGGGLVGPNLTDDYWIHGDKFSDTVKVIWNGVPDKGMVTWKGMLKPDEILAVASYIYTLRGTKPPNPKPPENQAQPDKPNIYE